MGQLAHPLPLAKSPGRPTSPPL